jgi:hypothetical protein
MFRTTALILTAAVLAGACGDDSPTDNGTPGPLTALPTVTATTPVSAATAVARNTEVTATFSEPMEASTINSTTFTLSQGGFSVAGSVTYSGVIATFVPTTALTANTLVTATITTGAEDIGGDAMATARTWAFTTVATSATGPSAVNLGTAANYVILAKTAVSTTGATAVTGNIALSPAAATFITGFGLSAPPTTFATSALVTGQVFAANYNTPTPATLTTAVLDMQTAYTNAAGRTLPDFLNLGAGNINALTLSPGLYKWGTSLSIPAVVTLNGGVNDVFIFQVAQNLVVGNGATVTLTGGVLPQNIFWQVAGQVTLGTTSNFKGIILSQTLIAMNTGSVLNGRALAQTAVTLNASTVTAP